MTADSAAFLVEPIQGEGGIVVPRPGYLAECKRICERHNVLLIADEIQTCLGRTGRLLASEHDSVKPDGLLLGKALGGGLVPVSLFLARADVMDVFRFGDHGSTFGGYPIAAAIGLEALNLIEEEDLCARAERMRHYLMEQLAGIESPLVKTLRRKGLLIGMEIHADTASARTVCEALMAHGVLSKETHETVVRFAPPLVISKVEINWAVQRATLALENVANGVSAAPVEAILS